MEKIWKRIIIIVLLITIAITLKIAIDNKGKDYTNMNLDQFAECLSDQGIVMYGTEWCSHCQNQKNMFGSSFEKINFVDCDLNREECIAQGVEGYPTWKLNGKKYLGEQTLIKLSRLTGCTLN